MSKSQPTARRDSKRGHTIEDEAKIVASKPRPNSKANHQDRVQGQFLVSRPIWFRDFNISDRTKTRQFSSWPISGNERS